MSDKMVVYPLQQNTNVDVGSTPSEVSVDESKVQVVQSTTQDNPVTISSQEITILTAGIQGPPGTQGAPGGEDEMPYDKEIDFIGSDVIYIGEADPGSATSSPVWRIKKLTKAVDNDVSQKWADGVGTFTKIWDNRLSYTY